MASRSSSFKIKIETHGLQSVQAHLERLRQGTTDMTPIMEDIGRRLSQRMRASIVSGKTASGRKAPRPHDGRALFDSGALADSITYHASRRRVKIGSPLDYSYYVNWGSIHNRPGLFLGTAKGRLAAKDKRTIGEVIRAHILQLQAETDAADQSLTVFHRVIARMLRGR